MARYAIEICGPRNENAIFAPLGYGERLRGRWDMAKTAHRNKGQDSAGECFKALSLVVSSIPGLFIILDTDAKRGQIADPLGETDAGKEIQRKIKSILTQFSDNPLNCGTDPRPTQDHKLSVDQVKTWLFHMRTMLDTEMAVPVSGSSALPDIETIKRMPGRRASDPACTIPQRARSADHALESRELYQWADEVPVGKGKAEPVGAGAGAGGDSNEQK